MATVRGGDRSGKVLRELAKRLGRKRTLRVGFLENATYPDGTPVALVAAVNNFGAPAKGIPARPFFTNMVLQNKAGWGPALEKLVTQHRYDATTALNLLGEGMVGQLQASITSTSSPADSPVTDLLKQRFPMRDGMTFADVLDARRDVAAGASAPASKPLVWSSVLLNSAAHDVQDDAT